ncbi:MAG: metallophosphoesterase family protein [Verrucomicrobiia bacterium]|jgi:hypothetical protein
MKTPQNKTLQLLFTAAFLLSALPLAGRAQTSKELPPMASMRGTGSPVAPVNPKKFSFVVFGDSQGQENHPTLRAIYKDMKTAASPSPALALCLGDIIRGEPTAPFQSKAIEKQLQYSLKWAKRAGIPVYNAPGNHEMDDVVSLNPYTEMPSLQMRLAYEKVIGPTYGAFDYGNSHFIILNTEDVPPPGVPGPPPGSELEFSYIGTNQLAQLEADLNANKGKKHIFIAMHYPMYAHDPARDQLYGESRTALVNMFAKYSNIAFVVASHEHIYYNPKDPNNVTTVAPYAAGDPTRHLISGGAGAPFWQGGPQPWAFHHYLLFEIDGGNVTVTIKRVR